MKSENTKTSPNLSLCIYLSHQERERERKRERERERERERRIKNKTTIDESTQHHSGLKGGHTISLGPSWVRLVSLLGELHGYLRSRHESRRQERRGSPEARGEAEPVGGVGTERAEETVVVYKSERDHVPIHRDSDGIWSISTIKIPKDRKYTCALVRGEKNLQIQGRNRAREREKDFFFLQEWEKDKEMD